MFHIPHPYPPTPAQIPPPSLNGGLYTGEKFKGEWGNYPATPDVVYMMKYNLLTAKPPPGATCHYPGTIRPGNNSPEYPDIHRIAGYNLACGSCENTTHPPLATPACFQNYTKYGYLNQL
jgi:hypothetical protein